MKRPWLCITAAMALGEVLAYVLGDLMLSWIAAAILTPSVVFIVCILYRFMTDKRRTVLIIGIAFLFGFFIENRYFCAEKYKYDDDKDISFGRCDSCYGNGMQCQGRHKGKRNSKQGNKCFAA